MSNEKKRWYFGSLELLKPGEVVYYGDTSAQDEIRRMRTQVPVDGGIFYLYEVRPIEANPSMICKNGNLENLPDYILDEPTVISGELDPKELMDEFIKFFEDFCKKRKIKLSLSEYEVLRKKPKKYKVVWNETKKRIVRYEMTTAIEVIEQ